MSRVLRRSALAVTLAMVLCCILVLHATGFYISDREMSCNPGGVAPEGQYGANYFDYAMQCWPDQNDCSSKQLWVYARANTDGDHSLGVNIEVFWDDGTSDSRNLTYPSGSPFSPYVYSTSWVHQYADNGIRHPSVTIETESRNCSYPAETLIMP
jgi:hypothetical protein